MKYLVKIRTGKFGSLIVDEFYDNGKIICSDKKYLKSFFESSQEAREYILSCNEGIHSIWCDDMSLTYFDAKEERMTTFVIEKVGE